jgi:hypothetical protein
MSHVASLINNCHSLRSRLICPTVRSCKTCPELPIKRIRLRRRANQPHIFARLRLSKRGASRSSRVLGWRCGGRERVAVGFTGSPTNGAFTDGEVVWSWHPGADAERNALARCRDTGARKAGPRGEREGHRKPSRREGRDVSAKPVVPAACIFFCRRAMGAASSRPSLRPLEFRGRSSGKARADHAARRRMLALNCLTFNRRTSGVVAGPTG